MTAPGPHDLFVGEMMGAQEPSRLHLPGSRLGRRGGVTWQQDTAGNWIRRLEAAAARSEALSRGSEGRSTISLRTTNPSKSFWNQQQLHRELLFTHRKGLSLRSKPELLQVLEHRNRRREGTESSLEQSPLEQELLRWQQRREQHHQQEATGDTVPNQPEFIRVRENLRRTQCMQDPPPQHAASSSISNPFLRSHLTSRKLLRILTSQSDGALEDETPMLQGSPEAFALSQDSLADT
ncbi:uncharacterized protein LOC100564967 [Anolis carolinensis]|uniref:uncharacterized protein LOC100564967 n=1 Tax=Anolis carolinensis TaxID=28377 RepID=UPI002F2B8EBF